MLSDFVKKVSVNFLLYFKSISYKFQSFYGIIGRGIFAFTLKNFYIAYSLFKIHIDYLLF